MYWTCPLCGANLDKNEKCDCEETAEKEKKVRDQLLVMEKGTNQLTFNWSLGKAGL